ncbi:hypothetical protein LUZ62_090248 [Rhynchospora pubera]|uniref:RNase H type-1 domain-containing protein n=1 Tax=Rhynchospora pubera TaxID=906938 RepID=A0AAV8CP06_9POAL|nr:hypothetical protein LUZ62_090248 [Rhynchospora pubera]
MCQRCGMENEFVNHMFFFCPHVRMVWFASQLALRTDYLPLSFPQALSSIISFLDDEQFVLCCNLLWSVWKARNKHVLEGKCTALEAVIAEAYNCKVDAKSMQVQGVNICKNAIQLSPEEGVILLDASWDTSKASALAFMVYDRMGNLICINCRPFQANSPFQAEAIALEEAAHYSMLMQESKIILFSDCRILVNAVNDFDYQTLPDWHAMEQVCRLRETIQAHQGRIEIRAVKREVVENAHMLANEARRRGTTWHGFPTAQQLARMKLKVKLDAEVFFKKND